MTKVPRPCSRLSRPARTSDCNASRTCCGRSERCDELGLDGDPLARRPPAGGDLSWKRAGDLVDESTDAPRRRARLPVIHPMPSRPRPLAARARDSRTGRRTFDTVWAGVRRGQHGHARRGSARTSSRGRAPADDRTLWIVDVATFAHVGHATWSVRRSPGGRARGARQRAWRVSVGDLGGSDRGRRGGGLARRSRSSCPPTTTCRPWAATCTGKLKVGRLVDRLGTGGPVRDDVAGQLQHHHVGAVRAHRRRWRARRSGWIDARRSTRRGACSQPWLSSARHAHAQPVRGRRGVLGASWSWWATSGLAIAPVDGTVLWVCALGYRVRGGLG